MLRHHLRLARFSLLLADGIAAVALFAVVSMLRLGPGWQAAWIVAGAPWLAWAIGYGLLWICCEWLLSLDQLRARWTLRGEAMAIVRAALLAAVAVFSILFLVHAPEVSRLFLLVLFASQVLLSLTERGLLRLGLRHRQGVAVRNLLVLGTSARSVTVAQRLVLNPSLGYGLVGHLGEPTAACPSVLGALADIERILHSTVVDEVLAVLDPDEEPYLAPIGSLCAQEGKRLRVVLSSGWVPVAGGRVETFHGDQVLTVANGPDRVLGLLLKRMLDIGLSSFALLVLAPIAAAVTVAVKLEDGGPVFFRQARSGLHGRAFTVVKFRTMVPDAEGRLAALADRNEISGHAFKVADDPRVTRVGHVLRRTSLDEMPQFWNVLRGDMSIVGPRPPLPGEVAGYDLWHRRRLSMKPGITGLWQVSARLEAEFDRWVELDLIYIDRWSLWLDFKIMVRTVPAMLSGR